MTKKSELTPYQKAQIVTLRQEGLSFREIESRLKVGRSTASDLWKKFQQTGSLINRKRSGRPSMLTQNVAKKMTQIIQTNPKATSAEIQTTLGNDSPSCSSTVRRWRRILGFTSSKGKPTEALSERHKSGRLDYCHEHRKDKFSNVLFSDEKPFELFKQRRKVWRRKTDPVVRTKTTKYPPKVQVWAGISKLGKTEIVLWKKRGTALQYQQRIKEPLQKFQKKLKGKKFRFQQDKDTTHTAKSTHQWLDQNIGAWFETPSKSPDLNPIELIWNTLESRVLSHNPETQEELEKWIKHEWDQIDQPLRNRTINHSISLIPKIILAKGDYVD